MALHEHHYAITVSWTGNRGTGTSGYREYGRGHDVTAAGLPTLHGSADPTFHGDRDRWNPELLLLTALAQCHMLSYLHVAVNHGIVVTNYRDEAVGVMRLNADGSGQFISATLRPVLTVTDPAHLGLAAALHEEAAQKCFIARSVNFPVHHAPTVTA
ncbi:OsmC family protein [Paenarthrobacter sp. PH39-S1]|uniref:OsmC family protein n=1 Tax=Paenarthrobacter sp. PH39-S1 TaxID=3046204 RepID=UPI0024BA3849|nr:OsmC family protein [Paenarthrobacter sp. PH39-S1]MDJ0357005.1 OsmC family protein [Paenarthrobacter sp. PH39-S1]